MKPVCAAFLIATAVAGCAAVPSPSEQPGIYHYIRANRDGSEPEHVVHFQPDARHIAVYKWVEKCSRAAYVTADFDPVAGEATALYAGKVAPDGSQAKFGRIVLDPTTRTLDVRLDTPDGPVTEQVTGVGSPWALFDYDLADLNAAFQSRVPVGDFAFWWGLVWPDSESQTMMRKLGWVDARDHGITTHNGSPARRFDLILRSDPAVRGQLWIDPVHGHIIAADFDRPNHDNYSDFSLRLERIEPGGRVAWEQLLAAHYAHCTAAD